MYITYLRDAEQHSNAASSHPGLGATKEESVECSLYWPNQLPWTVTVAASKAPKWAQLQAWNADRCDLESRDLTGIPTDLTDAEYKRLQSYRDVEIYA